MRTELVPIFKSTIDNDEVNSVNARDLHEALGVGKFFANWIRDRIEQCQLVENTDYVVFANSGNNPQGGRPSIDYALSMFAAKHLAMMERNDQGKKVRQYFIDFEAKARGLMPQFEIPTTLSGALYLAAEQAKQIEEQDKLLLEQTPKVESFEHFLDTASSVSMGNLAKVLTNKFGIQTGRNRLFEVLREMGVIMYGSREPYQKYVDGGYFEQVFVPGKAKRGEKPKFTVLQTRVTPKGVDYIGRRLRKYNMEAI
jgi:anti-repressor protein